MKHNLTIFAILVVSCILFSQQGSAEPCFTQAYKATRYENWNSNKMNSHEEATEVAQLACGGTIDLATYLKVRRSANVYSIGIDDHRQAIRISVLIKNGKCSADDYMSLRVNRQGVYSYELNSQDYVIKNICGS